MRRLHLWLTKEQMVEERLRSTAAAVMDVFLATTILAILERDARADDLPIAGFDLGPFPDGYGPEAVRGREVVYSTSNGTRSIGRAEAASPCSWPPCATRRPPPAPCACWTRSGCR